MEPVRPVAVQLYDPLYFSVFPSLILLSYFSSSERSNRTVSQCET